MEARKVYESIGDILKPKGVSDVLNVIKDLSVEEKISKIKDMHRSWGDMYKNLLSNKEILDNIRDDVKKQLLKLDVIHQINYIEDLEKQLPDIFDNMRDENLISNLKKYILNKPLDEKTRLIYRFFKSWPDLFKDIEEDPSIDPLTNQIMLLFKIKGAINDGEITKLQSFIQELGKLYGRENIMDLAEKIKVPQERYSDSNLFNKQDLSQLKLSLFKETRSQDETDRDEYYDVYAFIGYTDSVKKIIDGEEYFKKQLGIENLVKLDKYDAKSLNQVPMMKVRAQMQYQNDDNGRVWGVYIPKADWNKNYAHNDEIPIELKTYIDKNKFNF